MNKLKLITGSLLAFLAVSAFTFNNLKKDAKAQCCAPQSAALACNFNLLPNLPDKRPVNDIISFSVSSKHPISITKKELDNARYIDDLIPYYPGSWIEEYEEVTIIFVHNGIEEKITAPDNKLTLTQQEILKSMGVDDYVTIEVMHKERNSVTHQLQDAIMNVSIGIKPATEATYPDGLEQLAAYLEKNSLDEIRALKLKAKPQVQIEFTINQEGKATDAKLLKSSENDEIDQLLIRLLDKMPAWKPAMDANGMPVTQKFEFTVGAGGC